MQNTLELISSISIFDPLAQFQITKRFFGFALHGFNNFAFMLTTVLAVFLLAIATAETVVVSSYDYATQSLFRLISSVVRENVYLKRHIYLYPLFYLFAIILLANAFGLLPFAFTITSSFVFTLFLSSTYFIAVNIIGTSRNGWNTMNLFLPEGAPTAIIPFLVLIEVVSYIARVVSLAVRLFANMMSGHALLKILIGFSWLMLKLINVMTLVAVVPWAIVTAVCVLETMIAFLQAYVFVLLVSLYINDVLNMH